MLESLIVILAILFLVALVIGAFAFFWNRDKAAGDEPKK